MVTSSSGINVLLHENVFFEIGFHFAKFYFYLQAKYQELLPVLPTCCQKLELTSQSNYCWWLYVLANGVNFSTVGNTDDCK